MIGDTFVPLAYPSDLPSLKKKTARAGSGLEPGAEEQLAKSCRCLCVYRNSIQGYFDLGWGNVLPLECHGITSTCQIMWFVFWFKFVWKNVLMLKAKELLAFYMVKKAHFQHI